MFPLLRSQNYIGALMFMLAAVLSIILHELAHGYAAIKNGDLTPKYSGRMTFNPASHFDILGFALFMIVGFGWAKPVPVNPNNFHNYRRGLFQVSIAGVLLNFIIAFISYPLLVLTLSVKMNIVMLEFLYNFLQFMFLLNLSLCVFNLLPIYPLDGFRIIESRARYGNKFVDFMYKNGHLVFIVFLLLINFTDFNILYILRRFISFPIVKFWGLLGL